MQRISNRDLAYTDGMGTLADLAWGSPPRLGVSELSRRSQFRVFRYGTINCSSGPSATISRLTD